MELQDLLSSEIFVKEGSGVDFKSPREYINPFIDVVSKLTSDFNIEVSNNVTNKDSESLKEHTAYGRYRIEAKLPESFNVEDSGSVIGMIIALDTQRPTFKCYSGKNVFACTNLTIFNANDVFTQENNIGAVYERVGNYIEHVDAGINRYAEIVRTLKDSTLEGNRLREMHGKLIEGALANPKLGHTVIIQAIKELKDRKSVYHAKDGISSMWNYYNAITEYIKKADILDRPSKTVILSELFLN